MGGGLWLLLCLAVTALVSERPGDKEHLKKGNDGGPVILSTPARWVEVLECSSWGLLLLACLPAMAFGQATCLPKTCFPGLQK